MMDNQFNDTRRTPLVTNNSGLREKKEPLACVIKYQLDFLFKKAKKRNREEKMRWDEKMEGSRFDYYVRP